VKNTCYIIGVLLFAFSTVTGQSEWENFDDVFGIEWPRDINTDCNGQIFSISENAAVKYDENWSSIEVDILNTDCFFTDLVYDSTTCHLWAYGNIDDCNSMWNLSLDSARDIDVLPGEYCNKIIFDKEGALYTVCQGQLSKLNLGGFPHFFTETEAPRYTFTFTLGKSGKIWALGNNEDFELKLYELDNNQWQSYESPHLGGPFFLFEDSDGLLWTRSEDGLTSFDGSSWTLAFSDYEVSEMIEDSNNHFWLATHSGLIHWDKENFTVYDTLNSEIATNFPINLTLVDDYLWMHHDEDVRISKMKIDEIQTDINEPDSNPSQFLLYPNPSHGQITIFNPALEKMQIDIYAMRGGLVSSQASQALRYSTVLEAGVYWVKLSGALGTAVEKVVIVGQ